MNNTIILADNFMWCHTLPNGDKRFSKQQLFKGKANRQEIVQIVICLHYLVDENGGEQVYVKRFLKF